MLSALPLLPQVERTKFYTDQLPQERPARAGEPIEYASLVAASDVAVSAAQLTTQVRMPDRWTSQTLAIVIIRASKLAKDLPLVLVVCKKLVINRRFSPILLVCRLLSTLPIPI